MYQLSDEQFLPISLQQAWDFFSSPKNLAKITPPEMGFIIRTKLDDSRGIYSGMLIDYTVKPLLGIPMHWRTEISQVADKHQFTDRQLIGPYKVWEHTHTFVEKDGGVLMTDHINYQLPLGFLGTIAHALLVRRKIESIFTYRKAVLLKMFN